MYTTPMWTKLEALIRIRPFVFPTFFMIVSVLRPKQKSAEVPTYYLGS